jgi:hypothetical protein
MSLWADLTEAVYSAALDAFGTPATLIPQDGSAAISITGIISNPAQAEEFSPGGSQGVSVVRFFVDLTGIQPSRGDTVNLNGTIYAVTEVAADTNGGAILKLRIT